MGRGPGSEGPCSLMGKVLGDRVEDMEGGSPGTTAGGIRPLERADPDLRPSINQLTAVKQAPHAGFIRLLVESSRKGGCGIIKSR